MISLRVNTRNVLMKIKQNHTRAAVSVLGFLAALLFFRFEYAYHLHFQEQYQLFEWTWAYFLDVVRAPGGLADWLGRCLTQFFYYPTAGAVIIAACLTAIHLLTFAVCPKKSGLSFALSFAPAVAMWVAMCDENILMGSPVAVLMSLAVVPAVSAVSSAGVRNAVELMSVPLLYWFAGPVALISVCILAARERKAALTLAAAVLFLLSVFVSQYLCAYSIERLVIGVHYHRFRAIPAWPVYVSALLCAAVVLLSALKLSDRPHPAVVAAASIAIAASAVFLVIRSDDRAKEEQMHFDFMLRMRMWNRMMMYADRHMPVTPFNVTCNNIALAHSDRMADSMFEYYQNGVDGLLPQFEREYVGPLATAEAYWEMGMVNTAQRFIFEAQEAIPDYQKSARCYKRLAETNIVNGDYEVARKYIGALKNTIYYRKWASDAEKLLGDEDAIMNVPEYALKRAQRFRSRDFFFSYDEMDSMLGLLFLENRQNRVAFDYLLAWTLLNKDIERFVECLGLVQYSIMPKGYQEALAMQWAMTHDDASGIPSAVEPRTVARLNQFIADSRAGIGADKMEERYGKTYWFYYFYR